MSETHPLAERIAESIKDRTDEDSRRTFLSRSAVGAGALLGAGGTVAFAQEDDDDDDEEEAAEEPQAAFDDIAGTDTDVLNYALTLEHLESAFYRHVLSRFSVEDFVDAEALQASPPAGRELLYGYVETIGTHEATHVEVLAQAVTLLGGEPAQEAEYNFGFETVGDALELGRVFENTGVAAYAGAAPFVESPDLLSVALSIHSVETRHATVLNTATGNDPVPDAFDASLSQQEVIDAVTPFFAAPEEEDDD